MLRIFYDFLLYIGRTKGQGPDDFILPRHGNATRPTTSTYYRKNPALFEEIDELLGKRYSTDKVYCQIAKKKEQSVSETVTGPKMIDNRKYAAKNKENLSGKETESEAENLVSTLRETDSMVQTVIFCKEQYISVNFLPQMINDLFR